MSDTAPVLDLSLRAWQATHGTITVIGTWSLHNRRPVLALVPTHPTPTHDRVIPCLVPLDMAWQWDEHTGDPYHAAATGRQFALALGASPADIVAPIRVLNVIREHLGDLLTMPILPDSQITPVADALITDRDTGREQEATLSDV